MRKVTNLVIALAFSLFLLGSVGPTTVHALPQGSQIVASTGHDGACDGLSQLGGTSCGDGDNSGQKKVGNFAAAVVTIISYIAGAIAIIMILFSGIRFMTSAGDANKVSAAKTALIYALIGIAVAALAQIFVHVALSAASAVPQT